ncbi:hypothetical protein [[Mycobacterium] fortunisiensis]|uniref:hypothetical protein n=1 Tax=[Mycobacterium] fortunisiensis TaxID=2600579 RepID=UPI001C268CA0|nr:hypothetical protein [[Mycobacterium] fortunisiensis]
MTTTDIITVPLPTGADPEHSDDWQPATPTAYRCVWTPSAPVADTDVRGVVVQWGDGTIATEGADAPLVYIDSSHYQPAEARKIAEAILQVADQVEQWAGRPASAGTSRLRLPREERTEVVSSLRESGLSLRAIEAATGISRKTVIKDLAAADQVVESAPPVEPEPVATESDPIHVDEQELPPLPEPSAPQLLDDATSKIDTLRVEVNTMLRGLPEDSPLMAAVDVVTALGYLKLAVVALDKAADQLDPRLVDGAANNIVMGAEDISDAIETYAYGVPEEDDDTIGADALPAQSGGKGLR